MVRARIYGKAGWPFTDKARSAHPEAEYKDVLTDDAAMREMLDLSGGQRRVPVIVEGEQVQVGYGGGSWGV